MGLGTGSYTRMFLASYTHLHALGTPEWAPALVKQAERHKLHSIPGSSLV